MTFLKLTAIAAFTAIPVVATTVDSNSNILPQQVELGIGQPGHDVAGLKWHERNDQIGSMHYPNGSAAQSYDVAGLKWHERNDQIGSVHYPNGAGAQSYDVAGLKWHERNDKIG